VDVHINGGVTVTVDTAEWVALHRCFHVDVYGSYNCNTFQCNDVTFRSAEFVYVK
jgi:hypothetical protein